MSIKNVGGYIKVFDLFVLRKSFSDGHCNFLIILLIANASLVNGRFIDGRAPRKQYSQNENYEKIPAEFLHASLSFWISLNE
jgi:hypothetical protein